MVKALWSALRPPSHVEIDFETFSDSHKIIIAPASTIYAGANSYL